MSGRRLRWIAMAACLVVGPAALSHAQTIVGDYGQQDFGAGSYYYQSQGQQPQSFGGRQYDTRPYTRQDYGRYQGQQGMDRQFDQGFDSRPYASPYYDWSQGRQPQSFDNRQFDRRPYASPNYDWSQGRQGLSRQFDQGFDSRSYASPYYDWSQGRQPQAFDDQYSQRFGDRWQGTDRRWQYGGQDSGVSPYGQLGAERWQNTQRGPGTQFDQGVYGGRYGTQRYDRWDYDRWQSQPGMGDQRFNQGFDQRGFDQGFGRQNFDQDLGRQYGSPYDQWQGGQGQFGRSGSQFQEGQSSGTGTRQGSRGAGGGQSSGGGQSGGGGGGGGQ